MIINKFKLFFITILLVSHNIYALDFNDSMGFLSQSIRLISFVFLIIIILFKTIGRSRKIKDATDIVDKIKEIDPAWNPEYIKKRVKKIFIKVQEAWMENDEKILDTYVTDNLIKQLFDDRSKNVKANEKNIIESINVYDIKFFEVNDYKDDTKDNFWMFLKIKMSDYYIDTRTLSVIRGNKAIRDSRTLFKFIRDNKSNWLLDEYISKVSEVDLKKFKSFSEEI